MHFDTTLNLVWLLLGALALASTIHARFSRTGVNARKNRCLDIVGVALIVAALFPYISATDDVLRIEHFNAQRDAQHNGSHHSKQTQNDDLMRLYETMDSPLVCPISAVAIVFFFISVVFAPVVKVTERVAPFRAGRSPPLTAF